MKFCKRCFYPESHPLNIIFDEDGICSGCRIHEEKFHIDWSEKEKSLQKIFNQYKSTSGLNYDCIIPVSGAKDSYYIVNLVKNVYGMNPLLVNYNKHYNTSIGHRNFAYLKTKFNCDAMSMVVQPQKVKNITKHTLDKFGSIYWHVLAGESVFPVQVAVRLKIPLIIWGAHQGLDQVGMFSHNDEVEMTRKYRKEHDLMGYEAEDLLNGSSLTESDVLQYIYPHDKEIEKTGVRGIYLGNYIPWDSKHFHEKMIKDYDFETAPQQRTFDLYNHTDCVHYSGLHDYIKYLKHGYSKVSDHASRELRWGRLTREQGFKLIQKFQDIKPADAPLFCKWLGISEKELYETLENFRNLDFWKQDNGIWKLKETVTDTSSTFQSFPTQANAQACTFTLTQAKVASEKEYTYKLIEKGFVLNV